MYTASGRRLCLSVSIDFPLLQCYAPTILRRWNHEGRGRQTRYCYIGYRFRESPHAYTGEHGLLLVHDVGLHKSY